ncbi:uncharacterized protein MYCGRDRAFT_94702 [Zymoseptoria tritici IPO323]|uniref:Uncharacterized protein n=1 Tax=Zymoseptoria tritici (strain CBS 115943 / IPO323) TaxID=336722 RepID=F9XGS9_ZYMTI|nr:uncharacterized protein MYCGRDRAFT_94702 [Zymoseptoria tritici IPO323]EGP85815.1 hypothetical protein MYCGRDRAFT_94702 [Zymoseptoria tritici IPO323]
MWTNALGGRREGSTKIPRLTTQIVPFSRSSSPVLLEEYNIIGRHLLHEVPLSEQSSHPELTPLQMTHILFNTIDAQTRDRNGVLRVAYMHEQSLRLARSDPALSRRNADNYACFAMAAYYPRGCWSFDPDRMIGSCRVRDELKV